MKNFKRLALIAFIACFGLASQALAHAHLTSSVPADKATVTTSPTELDLSFTEALNLKFTGVKVTGPKMEEISTGDAMLMDGDKGLMVPVSQTLDAGTYKVEWHALSTDGHKTSGTYSFTVK